MKTAEEVARQFIYDLMEKGLIPSPVYSDWMKEQIAQALNIYAEEYAKGLRRTNDVLLEQARAEALEEAANVVEDHYWDSLEYEGIGKKHGASIAQMIRALKMAG